MAPELLKFVLVRVLAGANKSRRLTSKVSATTRPTSSRVKKSMFDILWSRIGLEDAFVLDLFAGTGALGIEALSRGARKACFVDHSKAAVDSLRQNLKFLEISAEKYEVLGVDYGRFLKSYSGSIFDVAFLDPPYSFSAWGELVQGVPARFLLCETGAPLGRNGGVETMVEHKYGTTFVTLLCKVAR